ncbi:MAG: cytochrome c oxidase assembly protein [Proteobacteria bacterium]|nr:cytochrome c oxidase assembly protein [Pseudomonadota bacterium]
MQLVLRRAAIAMALLIILVVVLPPLAHDARHVFAAHMFQHLLLIAIAAPLLGFALGGAPKRIRPHLAWAGFVGVFLFWHWPAAFRWADGAETTRLLELASILAAAVVFWSIALSERLAPGGAAIYVMTAAVATDLPGVIMIFAPRAICTMPLERAGLWHLTPLADQQLAGLLMWVPANLVFFSIAVALVARWFVEPRHNLVAM